MGLKLCVTAGCMTATYGSRCGPCEKAHQSARNKAPSRRAIRYDSDYRRSVVYGACLCCGTESDITRHHVVPRATTSGALGGSWVPMCRSCNSSIGAKLMSDNRCPQHGGTER